MTASKTNLTIILGINFKSARLAITRSKLTIETLEKGVKYAQS